MGLGGGGREGELLKKMTENLNFRQKSSYFLTLGNMFRKKFQKKFKSCNFFVSGRG